MSIICQAFSRVWGYSDEEDWHNWPHGAFIPALSLGLSPSPFPIPLSCLLFPHYSGLRSHVTPERRSQSTPLQSRTFPSSLLRNHNTYLFPYWYFNNLVYLVMHLHHWNDYSRHQWCDEQTLCARLWVKHDAFVTVFFTPQTTQRGGPCCYPHLKTREAGLNKVVFHLVAWAPFTVCCVADRWLRLPGDFLVMITAIIKARTANIFQSYIVPGTVVTLPTHLLFIFMTVLWSRCWPALCSVDVKMEGEFERLAQGHGSTKEYSQDLNSGSDLTPDLIFLITLHVIMHTTHDVFHNVFVFSYTQKLIKSWGHI